MQVFAVGEIVSYMKESLESDPHLYDIWLSGEVSTLTRASSGHSYFRLKDSRGQLSCVMFRNDAARGSALLQTGAQVLAYGRVSLYPERGEVQFIASAVQPEGIGAREAEFRRLRDKLQAEGLFDEARKRRLPTFPRRIGVVTSPAGAVWRDVSTIVGRRWPLAELVLAPTAVQGELAVAGITGALQALQEEPGIDVILVARGGGSAEELWPFNDEAVARAIYGSRVPVVSAVGHETDYTLADYTADRRAPTPSAAAELATPDRAELAVRVDRQATTANRGVEALLQRRRGDVVYLYQRLGRQAPDLVTERGRLAEGVRAAGRALGNDLEIRRARLATLAAGLTALSPFATLARGYAIVRDGEGRIVREAASVKAGDAVRVRVADGEFAARVTG